MDVMISLDVYNFICIWLCGVRICIGNVFGGEKSQYEFYGYKMFRWNSAKPGPINVRKHKSIGSVLTTTAVS